MAARIAACVLLLATLFLTALSGGHAVAQAQFGSAATAVPNPSSIRDCQTIRQCRFERGGSYRGCISTYSCRVCKMVASRCEIGGRSQNCHEMRCVWGG